MLADAAVQVIQQSTVFGGILLVAKQERVLRAEAHQGNGLRKTAETDIAIHRGMARLSSHLQGLCTLSGILILLYAF